MLNQDLRRSCILALMLAWGPVRATVAGAQPASEVIVVPVVVGESAAVEQAAEKIEAELLERGTTLISRHDARDRFIAFSRAPGGTNPAQLSALVESAREAGEHVAFGRTAAAQRSVREVISRAEAALETLNRETAVARYVLDACLALVRSSLQKNDREAALAQAMSCRRLVPDLSPSASAHPAQVVGVVAEADNLLRRMRIGRLSVRSSPGENCSVYLNGRHLGTTPFELERASPGEYRVQVECEQTPERVHVVRLGDEPADLRVDSQFDRAIHTDPRLTLRYVRDDDRTRAVEHAVELGRVVAAEDVVLVEQVTGLLVLTRVRVSTSRQVARTHTSWTALHAKLGEELSHAIDGLLAGRRELEPSLEAEPPMNAPAHPGAESKAEDSTESAPQPAAKYARTSALERTRPRLWPRVLSVASVAVGTTMFALAGAYTLARRREGNELRRTSLTANRYVLQLEAWQQTRATPYALASIGAGVASAGLMLWALSKERAAPRWASVLAAVAGTGLALWGVLDIATGASCDGPLETQKACSRKLERRDRGALVLLSALPVLAWPLTQWVRGDRSPSRRLGFLPGLEANRRSLVMTVQFPWL
jgi:hypothetical protein